ncbi:MAG: hypothetical protein ACI9DH_000187 [Halioglobus sp.]|jgi:hypothetical protein
MSIPRILYLSLAIAGIVLTWYYNLQFVSESGGSLDLAEFIAQGSTNTVSKSLTWDLAIACIAGLCWIYYESKRLEMGYFWVYIILAFGIAYAFAFPLFLFIRQGKLEAVERNKLQAPLDP